MKKQFFLTNCIIFLLVFCATAQVDFITFKNAEGKLDSLFTQAETYPKYKSGNDQFFKDFLEKLDFPALYRERKIEATIPMMLTVTKSGEAKDFDVVEANKYLSLEDEILEKLKTFFKDKNYFLPAKVKKKNVHAVFSFDVTFKCSSQTLLKDVGEFIINSSIDTIIIEDLYTGKKYAKAITEPGKTPYKLAALENGAQSVYENEAVDYPAEFIGGQTELMKFLAQSIKYPPPARENNIQGKVVVKFIIEKDGSISNITVLVKINDLLDAESVRVVSTLPKRKPAVHKGQLVRTYKTLPVSYKLEG